MIPKEEIQKKVEEAKKSKKRNFTQRVEFIINFKDIDLKKPQNRIKTEITLPNSTGKDIKVGFFADDDMVKKANEAGADKVITKKELDEMSKDQNIAKSTAEEYDFFLAQSTLMLQIGKSLGRIFGPRGKMPKPLPPDADPTGLINKYKNSININMKTLPIIQVPVGNEKEDDNKIAENIETILKTLENQPVFERGMKSFVSSMYVKTTMGPSVKV